MLVEVVFFMLVEVVIVEVVFEEVCSTHPCQYVCFNAY